MNRVEYHVKNFIKAFHRRPCLSPLQFILLLREQRLWNDKMQIIRFISFIRSAFRIHHHWLWEHSFRYEKTKNYFRFNWIVITWIERRKKRTGQNNCTLMMIIVCMLHWFCANKQIHSKWNKSKHKNMKTPKYCSIQMSLNKQNISSQ